LKNIGRDHGNTISRSCNLQADLLQWPTDFIINFLYGTAALNKWDIQATIGTFTKMMRNTYYIIVISQFSILHNQLILHLQKTSTFSLHTFFPSYTLPYFTPFAATTTTASSPTCSLNPLCPHNQAVTPCLRNVGGHNNTMTCLFRILQGSPCSSPRVEHKLFQT